MGSSGFWLMKVPDFFVSHNLSQVEYVCPVIEVDLLFDGIL
jgi:hypothetical protein